MKNLIRENKRILIITSIIILLPVLVGLFFWNQLPTELATHFDANGVANGWSSKPFAVVGLPLFILACHWLCVIATSADPKKQNINGKIMRLVLWVCPIVSLMGAAGIYGHAFAIDMNMELISMAMIGVLFIGIGNYLPKCRQSYTVGIKLPWTLADEDNWNKTHRMAGPLWMLAGAAILLSVFLPINGFNVMLPAMLVACIAPTVYSFLYHKKKFG